MSDELERLIAAFLKAETDIINEIARLRAGGLVDYHAEAALERVQAILRNLENESWEYVPQMIERQFYVQHPEARKLYETVKKHTAGYQNAGTLTAAQTDIVQRLAMNLMGEITEATATVSASLESMLIGRTTPDIFRRVGLEQVASMEATGQGAFKMTRQFVEALRREGVTAFVDKAGRCWSLHTYGSMVLRTTSRQAEVLATLTKDPEQDLYKISSHNTTCKLCAPYEGRVYSASGTDPDFPPLADAFGKMDPAGPNSLANSWLNIHPNCLVPGGTILAEGVVAHTSREYHGPIIILETASGHKITVTPNHPILTSEGFVAAGKLKKGAKIIETTSKYRLLFGKAPNDINVPTRIEQISHSIVEACGGSAIRVKGSAVQFHGDGIPDSEVDIVFANGLRKNISETPRAEPVCKKLFPAAHLRRLFFFASGAALQISKRTFHAAHGIMSRSGFIAVAESNTVKNKEAPNIGLRLAALFGYLRKRQPLLVQLHKVVEFFRSGLDITGGNIKKFAGRLWNEKPIVNHSALDCVDTDSKMLRDLWVREPGTAERLQSLFRDDALVVSELVHVDTSEYSGKVYNLETKYGFYAYNNIVTHNCLHTITPWTPAGRTPEEIQRIKDFSNPASNPYSVDPRSQKQIEAYRRKEKARQQWLETYRQWEDYRLAIPEATPKTFATFQKHKLAGDDKYKEWVNKYREATSSDIS